MGCNTSKESTVPQESENKENQENQERSMTNPATENVEKKEQIGADDKNTEKNHVTEPSEKESKSLSAKTITLPSNGSAKSIPEEKVLSGRSIGNKKESDRKEATESKADAQEAATKIQAAFRGHQTRKSMKQPGKAQQQPEPEPTREELENEFRSDDKELCHAATKIQASFRGHMSRKQQDESNPKENKSDQQGTSAADEELDIDLTDPDLNKAASKIQATFRGHVTRKELEETGKNQ